MLPSGNSVSDRIHVVAAILTDAHGRILLTRRTEGRDLAGLWEFPGGKVEPGESVEHALRRELHEELGIDLGAIEPLIAVPHAYAAQGCASAASAGCAGAAPHKRILLDVQRVASFSGLARGRESQALAWVAPEKLSSYAMPAADRPVVAALQQPDRYLITPEPSTDNDAFLAALARALVGGMRRVQLRARTLSREPLHALALAARELARAHDAELLLNSGHAAGADIAAELDIGLHLSAPHLRELQQRPRGLLAASCHDADELRLAEALGCDFVVLGPVALTPTHPVTRALGWNEFAALREQVALPIYALGGMRVADVSIARAHGAQGIAAIRALWPLPPTVNPAAG